MNWFLRYGEFKQYGGDEVIRFFHVCEEWRVEFNQYWYFHAEGDTDDCLTAIIETALENSQFADFLSALSGDDVIHLCDYTTEHYTVNDIRNKIEKAELLLDTKSSSPEPTA